MSLKASIICALLIICCILLLIFFGIPNIDDWQLQLIHPKQGEVFFSLDISGYFVGITGLFFILFFIIYIFNLFFSTEEKNARSASYAISWQTFKYIVLGTTVLFGFSIYFALRSYVIVGPQQVIVSTWMSQKTYTWEDVKNVELDSKIRRSKNSKYRFQGSLWINFKDGSEVDLWDDYHIVNVNSFSIASKNNPEIYIIYALVQHLKYEKNVPVTAECIDQNRKNRIQKEYSDQEEQLILELFPQCQE